uniref:Reverse transcriptase domain-containing protein n=1 Tax=Anguilla anguilla TaxID=7936 RepID=A0A0E9WEJ9_ANGAN
MKSSFIPFLDVYKAFDTIEHHFMVKTLELFGYGETFIKAIKTLY